MNTSRRIVRLGVALLLVVAPLAGCSGDKGSAEASTSASAVPSVSASPVIPRERLPEMLLPILMQNLGETQRAECLAEKVLARLDDGKLALTDVDNYARNLTTPPMRAALEELTTGGECAIASPSAS